MSFSSVSFYVFMFAVFFIYWGIPHKFRYILLALANLIFYLSFGVKFLPVLIAEIIIAYFGARVLEKKKDKVLFALIIVLTLIPLITFKYVDFAIYTFDKVMIKFGAPILDHTLKLVAPIGISFYTFELISYITDVYKGKITAEKNIIRVFVFAGFFANITSGPIERAGVFLPRIDEEKRFNYEEATFGLKLVMLGLVKKICGANVLKQYVDNVFGNIYAYRGPVFIIAIVLYTYEIYLDFSGYTDMARGFGKMLGFDLSKNFLRPYLSCGVKEFFARWHVSLSMWLKDYVYIPLGGSRCKKTRKYVNLMVTFFVSGLWHGASFTFIVWGLLHGVYQCVADLIKPFVDKISGFGRGRAIRAVRIFVTFLLVSFAWMFFRANSLSDAKYIMMNMFIGDNFYGQLLQMGFLSVLSIVFTVLIIGLTIAYDVYSERLSAKGSDVITEFGRLPVAVRYVLYVTIGVMIIVLRAHVGAGAEFIYIKF